jgi:hypothetical protein
LPSGTWGLRGFGKAGAPGGGCGKVGSRCIALQGTPLRGFVIQLFCTVVCSLCFRGQAPTGPCFRYQTAAFLGNARVKLQSPPAALQRIPVTQRNRRECNAIVSAPQVLSAVARQTLPKQEQGSEIATLICQVAISPPLPKALRPKEFSEKVGRDCQIATGSAAAAGAPRRAVGAKLAKHPQASATPSRGFYTRRSVAGQEYSIELFSFSGELAFSKQQSG